MSMRGRTTLGCPSLATRRNGHLGRPRPDADVGGVLGLGLHIDRRDQLAEVTDRLREVGVFGGQVDLARDDNAPFWRLTRRQKHHQGVGSAPPPRRYENPKLGLANKRSTTVRLGGTADPGAGREPSAIGGDARTGRASAEPRGGARSAGTARAGAARGQGVAAPAPLSQRFTSPQRNRRCPRAVWNAGNPSSAAQRGCFLRVVLHCDLVDAAGARTPTACSVSVIG
jgi:hypothetical protein